MIALGQINNPTFSLLGFVFQPVVNKDRQIVSYEALGRCGHSGQSIYDANARNIAKIPFSEQAHSFIQSYSEISDFIKKSDVKSISFNIEPYNCTEKNLRILFDLCCKYDVNPVGIELELIETSSFELPELSINFAKRLGFTVALDDFGIGHSDISAVANCPFDRVKFDRQFLKTEFGLEMLAALHPVIKRAGMGTTIEGVETEINFQRLIDVGPDRLQGWLFGRGLSASDLSKMATVKKVV